MANRTDPAAKSVHGTNPQNLIEKIVREKIYQNPFWKEQCFALTAETLVDRAMELNHVGGTYGGNRKPTPFLCLTLKMLQIQPEKDIVVEFIRNEEYKYVRVLGAFYMRLVGKSADVYQYLEPLYNDFRKLRRKLSSGSYTVIHMDEFIDELLTSDYCCDITLPRVTKRSVLEQGKMIESRKSALEDDFEEEEVEEEEAAALLEQEKLAEKAAKEAEEKDRQRRDRRDKDRDRRDLDHRRDRERDRDSHGNRDRDRGDYRDRDHGDHRDRGRDRRDDRERPRRSSRSRSRERYRNRDRSRSPNRRRGSSPIARRRDVRMEEGEIRATEGKSKDKEATRKKSKKEEAKVAAEEDPEIAEANRLRASLGLKPLRV